MTNEEKLHRITQLGLDITTEGIAHVFVRFSGHTGGVLVSVESVDTDYDDKNRPIMIREDASVFSRYKSADEMSLELDNIIRKLEQLQIKEGK